MEKVDINDENRLDRELELVGTFSHPEPGEKLLKDVHSAVVEELSRRRKRRWVARVAGPLAAAACILLALAFWRHYVSSGTETATVESPAGTVEVAEGSDQIDEMLALLRDEVEAASTFGADLDVESTDTYDAIGRQLADLALELAM